MADRFPLIVNALSKKIEEIASGDRLDFSGNGIVINGDDGNGKYLRSDGSVVHWDVPGDVYLNQTQTLTNKTLETCTISGSNNTLTNIPNTALVNSGITVNGVTIALGGSVTTPDNNTTYSISAVDGLAATEKIIRLTSGGNAGAGVNDDVSLVAGSNVTLSRTGDAITINSSYVDTDTVTRLKSAVGGSLVTGDVTIAATGSSTVSQTGNTITINSTYIDTVTRLRVSNSGTLASGDFTFIQGGATTITDSGTGTFTISSQDTITRLRGTGGTLTSGDITIAAAGASTVSQSGSTITITSTDTNTVTRVRGTTSGSFQSGDITITASGATTVSQTGNTINISSVNTDTGAVLTASNGLVLTSNDFQVKNAGNFLGSRLIKWDSANSQFTSGIIEDNGSLITINGDLTVTGVTTTIDTANLRVADNEIELRKGIGLQGSNGGLRLNRTTDGAGVVQTWSALQWFESGGYWRTLDNGGVAHRFVTEGEIQTLTNKTLTSPTLTSPSLGIATATTINGVAITNAASATLTIANNKTFTCNNTLTFSGTDSSNVAFGNGGTVAYTSNTLSVFSSTSSTQLRGIITDETGIGQLVFNTNPIFSGSIGTTDTSIAVFNTAATGINAFGAATQIVMGATSGTTTIRHNVDLDKGVILGSVAGDAITVNGTATFANDFTIQGVDVGRGANNILGNMRIGQDALFSNTTGSQNTMVGYEAGYTINSGAGNVAVGYDALHDLGTGQYNIAIGRSAVTNMLTGGKNVGVGANTLEANTTGDGNVCIGHYAGAGCTGTGNVLIGPADDENITNSTYRPPTPTGNRQLVIGSGTGTWIRGDSGFNVSFLQDVGIAGSVTIGGNLTISGTTTTIDSTVIRVDDKNIELGDVQSVSFTATVVSGSNQITGVSATANLIPGMVVSISTAGLSVPVGTEIATITGNTITLTNNVTGNSGTATFNAIGPSDTSANGGGLILKGTTDKTLLWDNDDDAWTSSEHMDLASGKAYKINGTNVLTATALGTNVTASSLTSVGTLTSLTVTGAITANGGINLGDSDKAQFGDGNDLQIYHDGSNSYILDNGSGNLYLAGSNSVNIVNATGSETLASFIENGAVNLYYDNNKKFETTSIGAKVTGELVVNGPSNPADYSLTDGIFVQPANGLSGLTIATGSATNNAYINFSKGTASNAEQFGFAIGRDGATNQGMIKIDDVDVARFGGNSSLHVIGNHVSGNSAVKIQRTDSNISSLGFYSSAGVRESVIYSNTTQGLVIEAEASIVMAPSSTGGAGTFGSTGLSFPSGKGIDFSANGNAAGMSSELLNDYEEGTFTPTISFTSGSATVADAVCGYIKIGRLVHVSGRFTLTSVVSPSGELTIGGLPFTADNLAGDGNRAGIQIFFENATTAIGTDIVGLVIDNTTSILVRASGTTGSGNTLGNNVGASTIFLFGGSYRSA